MAKKKIKCNKNKVSNWILNIALFFSVFAFSGYNGNLHSAFQESTQTELVLSKNSRIDKSVISFKKAFDELVIVNYPSALKDSQHFAQLVYNQCLQAKFIVFSKKILSYKSSFLFLKFRIIHPTSEDDIHNILVG